MGVQRSLMSAALLGSLLLGVVYWLGWPVWPSQPPVPPLDPSLLRIKAWRTTNDFPQDIAQFDTVFWEPQDTTSLRQWLLQSARVPGAQVLEIGTGTGIVSLACGHLGADRVIATDINPIAVANARYNVDLLGLSGRVEIRQVPANSPGPFTVVQPNERFDLIISNPPWEDAGVDELAAHALYDPGFALLDGILRDGATYLRSDGKLLLAYGAKTAVRRILKTASEHGWRVQLLDARDLDTLPEVFLPGMLLELTRNQVSVPK